MSERLIAIYGNETVGYLSYSQDRLSFEYDAAWRNNANSFPLSLSMPLIARRHSDKVVRPFISGLLPDNAEVLRRWGQRFHVSPRNPFRLLTHVGEECAGAVQFLTEDRAASYGTANLEPSITWLSDDELAERIRTLVADHSAARRLGDQGQFSLAGAQPKTGLYQNPESKKWGIPCGKTPTTHIFKPNTGQFGNYDINEHFCLKLASAIQLKSAHTELQTIGDVPTIIVKRFDRVHLHDSIVRVHQEDTCQSLANPPESKYQNEGGPSARDIFDLVREHSSRPQEDIARFLDALIFNWLIGGTDAHAKNYGFLIAGNNQVRLAPLYDLSSCLPYPIDIPIQKAKLAMKIGGRYHLDRIGIDQWIKAASEWNIPAVDMTERLIAQAESLPEAVSAVSSELQLNPSADRQFLEQLCESIDKRAQLTLQNF
jgi:serine/threonine-protein kinase HipA